jgi:hypothetical protein
MLKTALPSIEFMGSKAETGTRTQISRARTKEQKGTAGVSNLHDADKPA